MTDHLDMIRGDLRSLNVPDADNYTLLASVFDPDKLKAEGLCFPVNPCELVDDAQPYHCADPYENTRSEGYVFAVEGGLRAGFAIPAADGAVAIAPEIYTDQGEAARAAHKLSLIAANTHYVNSLDGFLENEEEALELLGWDVGTFGRSLGNLDASPEFDGETAENIRDHLVSMTEAEEAVDTITGGQDWWRPLPVAA